MACCILPLALCFTFAYPFVWSRRISHDNKVASAYKALLPRDFAENSFARSSIFVRGFEYGTGEEAAKKHFGVVGAIKDVHFQSRGDAVITYEEPSAAARSVNELHKTTLEGQRRYVEVKLDDPDNNPKGAKPRGTDRAMGKNVDTPFGESTPFGRTIFVYGFDPSTDHDALANHFGTVGAIEHHRFQSKVSAVIVYATESAAQDALTKLNGSTMSGQSRCLDVRLDNRSN